MSEILFKDSFGSLPAAKRFTPGRVNLIGEHTDYNGGWVLPTALNLGLNIALSPRNDDLIFIVSADYDGITKGTLTDKAANHWSAYAKGAVILANECGILDGGADIAVSSTLPHGAGLSSSAALIVGILKLCRSLSNQSIDDVEISRIARRVENEYISMPCGIMDQMAVALSNPGKALQIDTKSLNYNIIPIPDTAKFVVIHSGQYRRLSEGRYKERKEECDIIKTRLGHNDICLISDADYDTLSDLPDNIQRRARHCMTEHRRTVQAAEALHSADMKRFGQLMSESHTSMRDDFDITLPSIDKLVDHAMTLGALGARMTGGGFGGCVVACIEPEKEQNWLSELLKQNPEAFHVC